MVTGKNMPVINYKKSFGEALKIMNKKIILMMRYNYEHALVLNKRRNLFLKAASKIELSGVILHKNLSKF